MKNILYAFSILTVLFSSCQPLEEVYDELDATASPYKRNIEITLASADYTGTNKFFGSDEQANTSVAAILKKKYPQLGKGSAALVTFKIVKALPYVAKTEYTLVPEDYALGGSRSDFSSFAQLQTFLNKKFPVAEAEANGQPVEGRWVTLTYAWYNGSGEPRQTIKTNDFYYINGEWVNNAYFVTPADYVTFERNRFNNFVVADEALLPTYFNKLLKDDGVLAQAGDRYYVSYNYYDGSVTKQTVMELTYNGSNWVGISRLSPQVVTRKFKVDKTGVWLPDVSIGYTLISPDDYVWISQQPALGTKEQLENLASFKNFYQSFAGNNYNWSDANVYTALAGLLKYKFPNAEVGQKYEVTFAYYQSTAKVRSVVFEKTESGEFEVVVE